MPHQRSTSQAALVVLIILQLVMLMALYAGVEPHPPAKVALFGIAPLLGAAVAVAAAALIVGPATTIAGQGLSLLAAASALLSFGPQKYFDPQFPLIWPAVLCGQVAAAVVICDVVRACWSGPSAQQGPER